MEFVILNLKTNKIILKVYLKQVDRTTNLVWVIMVLTQHYQKKFSDSRHCPFIFRFHGNPDMTGFLVPHTLKIFIRFAYICVSVIANLELVCEKAESLANVIISLYFKLQFLQKFR